MKTGGLLLLALLTCATANAQFGERKVRKILSRQLEEKLPEFLDGNGKVRGLEIDDLAIGRKRAKVRGNFVVKTKGVKMKKPVRFKGRIAYSRKKIGVRKLKVAIPGDRFLGFRRYRRIV